jgi:hypothetical protein
VNNEEFRSRLSPREQAEYDEALRQTLAGQMGELRRELRKLLNAIAGETPFRQIGSFLRRGA